MEAHATDDDRTLHTQRILPYPPQAVYDAFASPELLAAWWGPDGFTNAFEVFEFAVGGRWRFVMHGPDGRRYPNQSIFAALEPASVVVIRHDCHPYFTLTVRLKEVAGGTRLTWEQAFDDRATAQAVKSIVVPANEQNIDRLARVLARGAGPARPAARANPPPAGRPAATSKEPRTMQPALALVWPSAEYLPGYVAALERGWSADHLRGRAAADEELAKIRSDGAAFLASLVDREAKGDPVTLPDGSKVARIPGYRRWLWDGEFCGAIAFRWQRGTEALPPHCLGHVGYAVVPWKQGRGYATRALHLLLPEARCEGLRYVEITTDPENIASQRVVEANGGRLVERFTKPAQFGGTVGLRYRIALGEGA